MFATLVQDYIDSQKKSQQLNMCLCDYMATIKVYKGQLYGLYNDIIHVTFEMHLRTSKMF
jgi:hypothetical protein